MKNRASSLWYCDSYVSYEREDKLETYSLHPDRSINLRSTRMHIPNNISHVIEGLFYLLIRYYLVGRLRPIKLV